jgi:hypothetical protein
MNTPKFMRIEAEKASGFPNNGSIFQVVHSRVHDKLSPPFAEFVIKPVDAQPAGISQISLRTNLTFETGQAQVGSQKFAGLIITPAQTREELEPKAAKPAKESVKEPISLDIPEALPIEKKKKQKGDPDAFADVETVINPS